MIPDKGNKRNNRDLVSPKAIWVPGALGVGGTGDAATSSCVFALEVCRGFQDKIEPLRFPHPVSLWPLARLCCSVLHPRSPGPSGAVAKCYLDVGHF